MSRSALFYAMMDVRIPFSDVLLKCYSTLKKTVSIWMSRLFMLCTMKWFPQWRVSTTKTRGVICFV